MARASALAAAAVLAALAADAGAPRAEGASAGAAAEPPAAASPPGVRIALEALPFYYAGDPVLVRVTVLNEAETSYDNAKGLDLLGGMVISDPATGPLKRKPAGGADLRRQPAVLDGRGFFGCLLDLRAAVEGLDRPGRYSAHVQAGALRSEPAEVVVIPRFDPNVPYQATVETEYGALVFDLLGRTAPKHVQNFHDLGNQGYYDGSYFFMVAKGVEMHGGDTAGDGSGSPGYDLPLELDPNLPQRRGTLSMRRLRGTDHGSHFVICLSDTVGAAGQLSVFGTLASGAEALTAIENLPTSGRQQAPFYRPIKPAKIVSIRVAPAPPGSRATSVNAPAPPEAPGS
jgi:cyclophilin family peptidyl-prolyl cis-trans isomerase